MKLEYQVTSLELSKELKELGFKQDSLFYWIWSDNSQWRIEQEYQQNRLNKNYSSFTVGELGEMLPIGVHTLKPNTTNSDCKYKCYFRVPGGIEWKPLQLKQLEFFGDTEANARARLLIYLAKHKLINTKER